MSLRQEDVMKFQSNVKLDAELKPTDLLLQAWASDARERPGGTMHPLERMRLLHEGVVLGPESSPEEIMIIVDQAVLHSPQRTQALLQVWYKTYAPAEVKARRLRISRSALYLQWNACLWFMRGSFRGKGLRV